MDNLLDSAAYGGKGWSPRTASLSEEIGQLWGDWGVASESGTLLAVLLHRPGDELAIAGDPNAAQLIALPDLQEAQAQHDAIAEAYRQAGVGVYYVDPDTQPPPNLMYVADLFFMTPEGVVLGRPASTVRAGEERWIARRLADLGIPILRSVRGRGTFEGADASWVDPETVLLATGLRTNFEGASQVRTLLQEMGVKVIDVGLPHGTMHLMGSLRIVDRNLAIAWPGRVPFAAVDALREHGLEVLFLPDEGEALYGHALNFVPLAPREILMPGGNPITEAFYHRAGIRYRTVPVGELLKAAGGIACMTGILKRSQ